MTVFATMPKKSRIYFFSDDESESTLVQIFYNQPLKIRPFINKECGPSPPRPNSATGGGRTRAYGTIRE